MKTKLKSLKFRGLRSFAKEAEVNFPDSGMVLVRGKNLDTNGSSGSGKSSFLMALAYAFDYSPFPASSLQSWLTEEKMFVEVGLETSHGEALLRRGDKSHLTLNGSKTSGSVKAIAEKTTETIGLSPDMLAALTYRAQKKPGLFLSKTDSEKKEFLSQLLGLNKIEEAVDAAQEKIKNLDVDIKVQEASLNTESAKSDSIRATISKVSPLVDLTEVEAKWLSAKNVADRIFQHLQQSQLELKSREQALVERLNAEKLSFEPKIQEIGKKLLAIKSEKPVFQKDMSEVNKLNQLLGQCEGHIQTVKSRQEEKHQQIKLESERLTKEIRIMSARIAELETLIAQKDSVLAQLKKLEQNLCPTCNQSWNSSRFEFDRLSLMMHQIKQGEPELTFKKHEVEALEAMLAKNESKKVPSDKLDKLLVVKEKLRMQIQEEENKLKLLEQDFLNNWKLQILEAQNELSEQQGLAAAHLAKVNELGSNSLSELRNDIQQQVSAFSVESSKEKKLHEELNQARLQNDKISQQQKAANDALEASEQAISSLKEKLDSLKSQRAAEQDFVELCGREGFLGNIFDEVLSEISEEVNRIMAMVPNVSHMSFAFKSESFTQKGTVKKNIVPVIFANGREVPLASGCSGGQQTSIELAVDLAVAEVVSRRTGAVPSWLILDECFEGLGTAEKEGCLEILQGYAKDRLVLVVDHASEFKEMFSQFIDIEFKNGESFLG